MGMGHRGRPSCTKAEWPSMTFTEGSIVSIGSIGSMTSMSHLSSEQPSSAAMETIPITTHRVISLLNAYTIGGGGSSSGA